MKLLQKENQTLAKKFMRISSTLQKIERIGLFSDDKVKKKKKKKLYTSPPTNQPTPHGATLFVCLPIKWFGLNDFWMNTHLLL